MTCAQLWRPTFRSSLVASSAASAKSTLTRPSAWQGEGEGLGGREVTGFEGLESHKWPNRDLFWCSPVS